MIDDMKAEKKGYNWVHNPFIDPFESLRKVWVKKEQNNKHNTKNNAKRYNKTYA